MSYSEGGGAHQGSSIHEDSQARILGLPCPCSGSSDQELNTHLLCLLDWQACSLPQWDLGSPSRQNSVPQTCPHWNSDNNGAASLRSNKSHLGRLGLWKDVSKGEKNETYGGYVWVSWKEICTFWQSTGIHLRYRHRKLGKEKNNIKNY